MATNLEVTILGLSITSSWGNGHATTYRHLVRGLVERGHDVLFLERNMPWYAMARDIRHSPWGTTRLYESIEELRDTYTEAVRSADLVIVGSYVPNGVAVGNWVTMAAGGIAAFYDIDTPVTLDKLAREDYEYVSPELIAKYDLYLSFTGGPTLRFLESHYGSPRARPLYCSVDPEQYRPLDLPAAWDLGYLGTYSSDRQPTVDQLLVQPAQDWTTGRFVVAGPQYPDDVVWPENVCRLEHVAPGEHAEFYNRQRYTLNVTRADMIRAGYSPSVRLFEAAACGTPIISDPWPGLDEFFDLGQELLVASSAEDVAHYLKTIPEDQRRAMGQRARRRVLARHTSAHRAAELEGYVDEMAAGKSESQ
jgi:spore maturation protein CgeB